MNSSTAIARGRRHRSGSAFFVSAGRSAGRVPCATLVLVLCAALCGAGPAAAVEYVSFYWDEAFTQSNIDLPAVPGVATGYLVLEEVADPLGVLGFELCLGLEGHAQVMGIEYGGNAINLLEPPCFVVGYASPVPAPGGQALLATCTLWVTDDRPTRITAGPTPRPSLPDQMAWIPASQPETLAVLTTADGTGLVGTINLTHPSYAFEPEILEFGDRPLGSETVRVVTVRNTGLVPVDLDLGLSPGCEGFRLTGLQGPLHLPVGAFEQIEVTFAPTAVVAYACELTAGPGLIGVPLTGSGREPIVAWTVSSTRYFGEVGTGDFRDMTAAFRNQGEVPLVVTPTLVGCSAAYSLVAGADSTVIVAPGGTHLVNVRFAPTVPGQETCALSWGPDYDQTPLDGTGVELVVAYTVTGHLNCGEVPLGAFVDRSITITNIGEANFTVAPAMFGCGSDLQLTTSDQAASLAPGQARVVGIRYRPTVPDSIACTMRLGGVVPDEPILAQTREGGLVISAPDTVDFGTVEVGATVSQLVTLRNTDTVSYTISPLLIACSAEFQIVSGGGVRVLAPGQITTVLLEFRPLETGYSVCALDLGLNLPPVALVAVAVPAVPRAEVAPDSVAFVTTQPGTTREAVVRLTNVGVVFFGYVPEITGDGFALGAGGEPGVLAPGASQLVTVRFTPPDYGSYAGLLRFGPDLPEVPLSGDGGDVVEACEVTPTALDFGLVVIGDPALRTVRVTNVGNVTLDLVPAIGPSVFTVFPASAQVPPGQGLDFIVTFEPTAENAFVGTLDFGHASCGPVSLVGEGTYPDPPQDADQIGIFFDPGFTSNEINLPPVTVQTAYLILRDASSFLGVSGWECEISTTGTAIVLTWNLQGVALNIAAPPEFVVGLATPLPWRRDIVLMEMQFLTLDTDPVLFALGPTSVPSLPGEMAWVDGSGVGLRPMFPITGEPTVASVNDVPPLGIGAPAPTCELAGGEVRLTWRAAAEPDDRCHVYRRVGAAATERLTDAPLAPAGGVWSYVDAPAGLAPGTELHYSYAVVRDGAELARSPETTVTVAGVPVVATRLLPNVPNPFNPQTEIRFETERPGRVRVSVFDVTGRLVRVLQDGHLDRGRWARTWQGRDEGGRLVASGAYYVRLEVDGRVDHRKIMLLK